LLLEPGEEQSTTTQSIELGLRWNLGQHFAFRYSPAWTFYSNDAFEDNLAHSASLRWQRSFVAWNVQASHNYARTSDLLIETGQQTKQELHSSSFKGQRPLGALTILELGLTQYIRSADGFSDTSSWSTQNWLHYQLSSLITTSAGFTYGYINMDDSTDMSYYQFNGSIRWHITERIDLSLRGGAETRRFLDTDVPDSSTPVYSVQLRYNPVSTTVLSVTGDRSVSPSLFASQVNRTATWQAMLSQRLFERFHLDLAFVRRTASHRGSAENVSVNREDKGRLSRVGVRTSIYTRGTAAVFYQHSRNRSNDPAFNFDGGQVGFDFVFRY
jgi:hypothetical protein